MIKIKFDCPCPKLGCSRHGKCDECEKFHSSSNGFQFCKREHGLFTKIFYRKNYEMVERLKSEGLV